jgi:putative membrane protein
LAKGIEWCFTNYPQLLWAFFFGLIIASSIYIIRQVDRWNLPAVLGLVVGAAVAYTITVLAPGEAPNEYWMVFLAGCIAISAMILPGISGSFILLLMGMYRHVLAAANDRNIPFLLVFMAGCVIGLLLFSHLLSWTFKNYENLTLAVLSGFMLGSIKKVWPWQNVTATRVNSHGETVPYLYENVLPSDYVEHPPYLLLCIGLCVVGFVAVFLLERLGEQVEEEALLDD